jgi:hypothetical protein
MRSAYVNPAPHEEAKNNFAFGLRHGAPGKTTNRTLYSDLGPMTSDATPRTVAARPTVAPARRYAAPAPAPAPTEKKCPGTPKCLTSFPKDWLWTAAPASPPRPSVSWPGNSKRGRDLRIAGSDLFGA